MNSGNLLQGVYDLHIHTAPDVVKRKCTDREAVERMLRAGMGGGVIKNHYFETISRSALLQADYPDLKLAGGITLNRSVGGVNPEAVRRAGEMGGKMLWFPTMDALSYQTYHHRKDPSFDGTGFLSACGPDGELLPEVYRVLELAAKYRMVVGTGHLSPAEGLKIVRAAKDLGVQYVVLTHAENPAIDYSAEQQLLAVSMGAYVEHSYFNVFFGRCGMDRIISETRLAGSEHVLLTGDFGQTNAPYFDDGMRMYLEEMKDAFSEEEMKQMTVRNPERILA